MKPRTNPLLHASRLALTAITLGALPASAALSTWDGGAGDTNINSADNWNPNGTPTFGSSLQGLFQTTTAATINTNVAFGPTASVPAVAFSGNFTFNAGGGILTLYGTNSGIQSVLRTNSGASTVTIDSPIEIFATSPSVAPLGNLLILNVNNATAANTALNITGGISRASGSSAASYDLRFGNNVTVGVVAAKAKISSAISGLGSIVNANPGGAQWSGDLIIAGDQASVATSNITISSGAGFGTPQTSARIVLGESNTDDQTWNNITLNNVMNLAIGGNITANAFSGNTANTKITGASATGSIAFNSGTIGANVILGGGGTHENDLSIIKKSSGTLNINSTTATYTGGTIVEAGTLNLSSATSLASPITVKAGGTLTGEGSTTSSLTFDTGTSTLGFDATSPGSLTVSSLVTTGASVIASPTGATTIGVPYTVLTNNGGNFSAGDVSAFLAGGRGTMGGAGTNQITYTPSAPASLVWKGNDGTNPTFWDIATTFNWSNGSPDRFFANDNVTFDNTASTFNVAVQGSSVSPGNIVFDNSLANPYTLSGGGIGGGGSLTKNSDGVVTIGNTLSHTGGIAVNAGTLSLGTANSNSFTGGISIASGELQFGGATLIGSLNAQPVTMTGGTLARIATTATITNDVQTFAMNANGVTIKVDTNTNTTWRIGGKISGSGNWTKSGPGVLAIGQNNDTGPGNDFSGTLTVTGGTLDIRHGDSLGTTAGGTSVQDAILLMQNFSQTSGTTITVNEPLDFSGTAFLNGYCQENKTFTQQFNGAVTVAASAVLGISTARNSSGALAPLLELNGSTITTGSNSLLSLGLRPASLPASINAAAQTINIGSSISGPGSVTAQGESGSVYTLASPGYSGNTTVNSARLKLDAPNTNNQSSTVTIAATGATLELNFDESGGPVTDTVDKLFIGGVQQPAGVYKATDNVTDSGTGIAQITGPGTLTVSSSPVGGFNSWASANGIPGALPGDDADFDSLSNLTEYALGTNPTASTPAPGTWSGNTITYSKGATAIANGDVNYIIETSTDLGVNDPWAPAVTQNAPDPSTSIAYTFTPGGPAKKFARLRTVLIP
jgi:autotransporter-associated beta strand protein